MNMTPDSAALLMNKFFDDDSSDDELKALFSHLAESEAHRTLFVSMKRVNDSLLCKPDPAYPKALDQKFSALAMNEKPAPLMRRKLTLSVPSALLAIFVVCILSLVFFSSISSSSPRRQTHERQATMTSTYPNEPGTYPYNQK
jgi:ferric-dicitrate binding protein FerR (iron transport regulator)